MYTKEIIIDDIGLVKFKNSNRAKYIRIQIKEADDIIVTIPQYGSFVKAMEFVEQNRQWIIKTLKKNNHIKKTIFETNTHFETQKHKLNIVLQKRDDFYTKINNGLINVYLPNNVDIKKSTVQDFIRKSIEQCWKNEAIEHIIPKVHSFAKRFNFRYNKVAIRNTISKWGSCSATNNISLSLHLMRLPNDLINYVIMHELTHTIVKNHSKEFWSSLELFCKKAKEYDKLLNKYDTRTY